MSTQGHRRVTGCVAMLVVLGLVTGGHVRAAPIVGWYTVPGELPIGTAVAPTGWGPVPGIDLVIVLDESGDGTGCFSDQRQLARDLVSNLEIGSHATTVGVVAFRDSDRTIIALSGNGSAVLNALDQVQPAGGNSASGTGIYAARSLLLSAGRSHVDWFTMVMAAGADNRPLPNPAGYRANAIAASEASGITLIGVGVGPIPDAATINDIASDRPDMQTAFMTPDYDGIKAALDSVILQSVTVELPDGSQIDVTLSTSRDFQLDEWVIQPGNNTFTVRGTRFDGTQGQATLTLVGVPEPATLAMLALGGLFIFRRRRVGRRHGQDAPSVVPRPAATRPRRVRRGWPCSCGRGTAHAGAGIGHLPVRRSTLTMPPATHAKPGGTQVISFPLWGSVEVAIVF